MTNETAFGWRTIDLGFSSGLDFLGLAGPIEGILDAETSGLTNATARARYFSIVPWYYWKYAKQGGEGSAKDQRRFAIGFEMLLAYANIAWLEQTGGAMSGIIRRDFCETMWKEDRFVLPLRGDAVGDTPSPLDAALYGPSLRRLNLIGQIGQLHTCRAAGQLMAEELDKTLGAVESCQSLLRTEEIERETVGEWAQHLSLERPTSREIELLRSLLFADAEFDEGDTPPRVFTMLLLLNFAAGTENWFTASDVEVALATGNDFNGQYFHADPFLREVHTHWRILALLKFLRHACEMAFAAVHAHVQSGAPGFASAERAAADLIEQTVNEQPHQESRLPDEFGQLVDQSASILKPPSWKPRDQMPTTQLRHAIALAAWCHALLKTKHGQSLLDDEMACVGESLNADLRTYADQMDDLVRRPLREALRWLSVDRAIARHFQVAARKLVQHDTFRLIEDEEGVKATAKCPIADVAIRIDSMLSLISDLQLLRRGDDGYAKSKETEGWYKGQLERFS